MARSRHRRAICRLRVDSRAASASRGFLDVPRRQLPELDLTEPIPECLDSVPVKLPGPVGPAAQPVGQPVVQRVADRIGRAGPDATVQVAAQVPELGPDLRLCPAGHLPADTLTALVTKGDGGHPVVVAWS